MPYIDVFIGSLDDPRFVWDYIPTNNNESNHPHKIGPEFPDREGFGKLIDKIKNKEFYGKQVDWGAWAAIVTKKQIEGFVEDCYGGNNPYADPKSKPVLDFYEKIQELKKFVSALDPNKKYYLTAMET